MDDPLYIERNGHRTWLKWHRARRRASDPAFTGARILEAMRLGASVEVDLVVTGDGGFAVLHNFDLDRETTGTGPVRETRDAAIRELRLRDNDGAPLDEKVMLLDDLCRAVAAAPLHEDALLQLDLKEARMALSETAIGRFAESVGPVARGVILSSGDAEAVAALRQVVPGMRIGFDPSDEAQTHAFLAACDAEGYAEWAVGASPDSAMFYLHWQIVMHFADRSCDVVEAFHRRGKRIDAWTINQVTPESIIQVERLLELNVDQITTDDPEGLKAALEP